MAAQLKQIATLKDAVSKQHLSSLHRVVSSSALLEQQTIIDLNKMIPCPIYNCYGTTEIAIASTDIVHCDDGGIVGEFAPNIDVKISDEGEILVKSTLLFDGYYNLPEITQESMTGDYFKTGDYGEIDGDELIYRGRIKELINVGGTKVYPQDVEQIVSMHPDVEECAAFPEYDEILGEIVSVAVVAKDGLLLNLKTIQTFCLELLMDSQLPRKMHQVLALPKTESGKIKRYELTNLLGKKNESNSN